MDKPTIEKRLNPLEFGAVCWTITAEIPPQFEVS